MPDLGGILTQQYPLEVSQRPLPPRYLATDLGDFYGLTGIVRYTSSVSCSPKLRLGQCKRRGYLGLNTPPEIFSEGQLSC